MKKFFVISAVLALIIASLACGFPFQTSTQVTVVTGNNNTVSSTANQNAAEAPLVAVNPPCSSCANGTGTNDTVIAEAPAFTPVDWDKSCKGQVALLNTTSKVTIKVINEGGFIACKYILATPGTITVPDGMIADMDMGGIFVGKGPVDVAGEVAKLTLRPMVAGTDAEACAQVANLTNYGQTQSPKFTASIYNANIICP